MIKQDYLIRMIQECIALIVEALLHKKKVRQKEWDEYDAMTREVLGIDTHELLNADSQTLIARFAGNEGQTEKLELAAVSLLKLSEDVTPDNPLLKSKLREEGTTLLKHVQLHSHNYSLQREMLLRLLDTNG